MMDIILSYYQTRILLQDHSQGVSSGFISPDLGFSADELTIEFNFDDEGVHFAGGVCLLWEDVQTINGNPQACFKVTERGIEKIQVFSEEYNRLYSLMPTAGAPTMLISGIPMHRIKDVDPWEDTRRKIKVAMPKGQVLDTATGLGYTAIFAAQSADHVTTIELDPAALDIARQNPWSKAFFASTNISQLIGDSDELLLDFADACFDCIIHDPPMFSLAGHLYSSAYYRQLYRLLRPGGRLFHYIGDPDSKSGRAITKGVVRRLGEAKFKRVIRKPRAFGVIAFR